MALYMIYPELILNALLATFNGRPSLRRKMMSVTVQHAASDSAQSGYGAHAKRQTKDINIVELGNMESVTSNGADISTASQKVEVSDKVH
ncbi:hypothetical protein TRAPUB_6741 [Trametes pubescens]|uniref:Uncharacterized protein n=1 Tax=Trametes pubescens TaxID=154538 RepID=A0A1M2V5E2_TRAPU|nr:hypothetical protein TRAPUB_6741 [Trametes pubescens]